MIFKMFIKGKDSINIQLICQGKAGAVSEAQTPVIKFLEDGFSVFLNIFIHTKNCHAAFVHLIHKLNRCGVAASVFEKGIDFIKNIIGSIKDSLICLDLLIERLCCEIMLVFRNSKGAEGACINKDFQSAASPYRYLS